MTREMEASEAVGVRCGERFASYPQLIDGATRAATGLSALGVGAGDRVALMLHNDLEFLQASFAAVPLGASAVPINWHWRADEVDYVLRDSEAKALIVDADLWPTVAAGVPDGVAVVIVPGAAGAAGELPAGALSWPAWLAASEPHRQAPERAPLSMIYTSGTTGRPKGVVREETDDERREQMLAMLDEVFGLGPSERTVIPAPMYHTAPNVYALLAVAKGMDMTIMRRFDPAEFLAIVERQRITAVQMVPTMFVRLLALPETVRNRYDLSSLNWVVHAAAPCPPDVKRAMIDWLGPIVVEYYGGTESGPVTFCDSQAWLSRPGTVGRPVGGAVVKILDAAGRELPAGESGDVYVNQPASPSFTYNNDPGKRASIDHDGLITVGDIGYLDDEGFLYLNDRRTDVVISGGVNIYPAEIESCLIGLDGVRDCAVFGIPDDEFGEALAAHIDADPELTADAVRAHLRERLAGYKVPRVIELSDSLPRDDTGKLFKRRLREPYWAGRDRRI
jgi:long-chain acyl-CoA synthetase